MKQDRKAIIFNPIPADQSSGENNRSKMAGKSKPKPLNVYLYIPNIIGYLRILMNCVAFAVCFVDKKLFSLLYFVSKALASCDVWLLCTSFARHTAMGTITGHQLVECYGMTEFDGICNPIGGKHRGGTVGKPFSAVQANIFLNNESGSDKTGVRELCIKGPSFRNIGSYLC
uniref:Phosphatidylinositol synthase n=2 Tax=Solanum tuberosum TaxID=4113 RepID=M1B6X6_SOLTU